MDIKIRPDGLADTIRKELDEYSDDVTDKVKKAVQDAADMAVKELKSTSPRRKGKYARSWRQKKERDTSSGTSIVIHAGLYQLTHLLENGHAKRGGGRVKAFVHIKPVETEVCEKLENDIKRGISNG